MYFLSKPLMFGEKYEKYSGKSERSKEGRHVGLPKAPHIIPDA